MIIALAIGIPLSLAIYGWLLARFPGFWPTLYGLVIVLTIMASVVGYFIRTDEEPRWEVAILAWGMLVAGGLWWIA